MVVVQGAHHLDGEDILDAVQLVGLLNGITQNAGHLIGGILFAAEAREDQHKDQHDRLNACGKQTDHLLILTDKVEDRRADVIIVIPVIVIVIVVLFRGPALFHRGGHLLHRDLAGGLAVHAVRQLGADIVHVDGRVLAEFLQIHQHGVGALIPLVQVGVHGLHADELQRLGDIRVQLTGTEGDAAEVLDGHGHGAVPLEGQAAGEHLIQHHTGAVNIAAGVQTLALGLLR